MSKRDLIKRIQNFEANAQRLLEDAAALREELSGGSDSSLLPKSALSISQREKLLSKRRKTQFK